jgi:hypothetical protein
VQRKKAIALSGCGVRGPALIYVLARVRPRGAHGQLLLHAVRRIAHLPREGRAHRCPGDC